MACSAMVNQLVCNICFNIGTQKLNIRLSVFLRIYRDEVGNSNPSLDFEPLDIGTYLSMPVRIFFPEISQGSPALVLKIPYSVTTSSTDLTLNYSQSVTVEVDELSLYTTNLINNGMDVGTNLRSESAVIVEKSYSGIPGN